MADWLRIIDRGIKERQQYGEPPVFPVEEISHRLAAALNADERDQEKLKLMNLCFDALVCIREQAARGQARNASHQ
jgi:hypothetical protein